MTRFGSLIFCAMLGTAILACGSNGTSPKDPIDLVPIDNTVPGWTIDQSKNPDGQAKTADSENGVHAMINGGSENYFQEPNFPKSFVWQNYVNSTLSAPDEATVKLYIFEMPSPEQAKGIYTAILNRSSYAARKGMPDDWEPTKPIVGTESRIQDTASQWSINFHQGVFYIEVLLAPSFGPGPDYKEASPETKQETIRFAQAIAAKI